MAPSEIQGYVHNKQHLIRLSFEDKSLTTFAVAGATQKHTCTLLLCEVTSSLNETKSVW